MRAGDLAGVQAGAQDGQVHRARDQLHGRAGGEELQREIVLQLCEWLSQDTARKALTLQIKSLST